MAALAGEVKASCSSPYNTRFPRPGWAEQVPEDWWTALGAAVRGVVARAEVPAGSIVAVGIDTTCCTVVALDKDNEPLRPALMWMDQRAADQARQLLATGDPHTRVNSGGAGPISAEWFLCKNLWIKQNEPDVWARAKTMCEYQDYLNLRLTGRMVASMNNASVRWHYSAETDGLPLTMLEAVGMPELAGKWPQELLRLGDVVGGLTEAAAEHLGLPAGTLVAQGGADAFVGMLGLGVVKPGQMALLTGSSHLHLGFVDHAMHAKGIFGTYKDAVLPGMHTVEGGQTSTGTIVNWFKRTLVGPETSYAVLDAEAEVVPPGCDGLSCLDHFQGNRTPHTDPLSRGAVVGLTLAHTRGHVFRALMESVAYGTRLILDTMAKGGFQPHTITIAGGATRSPLWLQIHADVCNVPFVLTKETDAPMLGSAVLAAVAAGVYPDIPSAAAAMVSVDRVVHPNAQAHTQYEQHYQRYLQLYPALKATFHDVSAAGQCSTKGNVAATAPPPTNVHPQGPGDVGAAPVAASHNNDGTDGFALRGVVSASILSADFGALAAEAAAALSAGAQWIHVDMFDGSYVDNFTLGPPALAALRAALGPSAFLDAHLAVSEPGRYIGRVASAGASQLTFHAEVLGCDIGRVTDLARSVRAAGMRAGVALAPATPADVALGLLKAGAVDLVLCMTVEPGFGGQAMLPHVLEKVATLRKHFPSADIQVDGGVNTETVRAAVDAGANIVVAGSALFAPKPPGAPRDAEALSTAVRALLMPLRDAGLSWSRSRKQSSTTLGS